ncbi:MAG: sensor histidine kinase, partial [Candidatus Limnocylindrus sp.]
ALTTSALYGDDWVAFNAHATLVFAAIATVFAYGPLLRTAMSLTVVLISPAIIGLFLLENESAPFYAAAAVVFCGAFLPLLPRLHHEYWISAVNARRIELQARELERAKVVAERASEAKSDFLATVSHEIRTPLSGILGAGALLLRMPLGEEQRDHAATMQRSAHDLLRLIDELLEAARLDKGRVEFQRHPFAPAQLVLETTGLFEASARQAGLLLHARIDPETPSIWSGDAGRIKQVLTNLVSNAVKFTAAGSIVVEVTFVAATERVRFSVTDTGRGVSASQRARLFHRFQQADDTIFSRYGGSGLGLAISEERVRAMGGELRLESEEGAGSCFWFDLPSLQAIE